MRKFLITGLASVALMGAASLGVSHAQTGDKSSPAQAEPMMNSSPAQAEPATGPADNQIANEVDARIAQLKANLSLSVDQEKNWPGLQSALHDYGMAQLKNAMERGNRPSRRDREQQGQNRRTISR